MPGHRADPRCRRRQVGPGGQAGHGHRPSALGYRLGRRELGGASVADGFNEIAELLDVLELAGAIVTIDAAGCQRRPPSPLARHDDVASALLVPPDRDGLQLAELHQAIGEPLNGCLVEVCPWLVGVRDDPIDFNL
ncbi:hypothetical protein P12x_006119 (plasmid) [Tundrisphaera lichenicola]|uniref:hypothetical protein n=1 Tax=Tundrisphaera lichenicola TaxID=2029860 RepID=UPI003EBE069E